MIAISRAALVLTTMSLLGPAGARAEVRATPLDGHAPRRPQHARGAGTVAHATSGRAYFDVGAADGLAVGTKVLGRRGGETTGLCAVDLVTDHAASCPVATLRAGDAIAFQAAPEPPGPKVLPALVPEDDLARRAAALQAAPPAPLVAYKAPPRATQEPEVRRAHWVSAEAGFAQWTSTDARALAAARLDLSIRDAELGAGVMFDLAARAERWMPADASRFRPGQDTRFYLWQAEFTKPFSRLTLSAGRMLPYEIPGATIFDGASASMHWGPAHVGVFGGVVPEPHTLDPSVDRATGGAFWSWEHAFRRGAGLRQDGRIAVVRSPELGTRVEATLGASAWWKAAHVSAEAQLGMGGAEQAAGLVDAARADVTLNVMPGLSFGGGLRHTGLAWPGAAGALEPARFPGRSDAADAFVSWDVWILRVGGTAGFSRDGASKLDRSWVGPEIGVPRLLGRFGGLSAGYLEEKGWLPGRSAWTQATFRFGPRYNLIARGSWTQLSNAAVDVDELGLLASGSMELGRGFGLRFTALSRTAVAMTEGAGSAPVGITAMGAVYASY